MRKENNMMRRGRIAFMLGLTCMAALAALGAAPIRSAFAAPAPAGDLTVEGGSEGQDWSFDDDSGVLTIKSDRALTISMDPDDIPSFDDRIVVKEGVTANIKLDGVHIESDGCAFDIAGATVNLTLKGTNELVSGSNCAGLHVPAGARLTVTADSGKGSLDSTGGDNGAGIGGGTYQAGGKIDIRGGKIIARSGGYGAGIGGGNGASAGDISISGGKIKAEANAGVAIGGPTGGGKITVTGGDVTANGAGSAAGIGGGIDALAGAIKISGGTVNARGGTSAAGIGGGENGSFETIAISGGTVTAQGGGPSTVSVSSPGAGIGSGGDARPGGSATITGGNISAHAGTDAGRSIDAQRITISGGAFGTGVVSGDPVDPTDRGSIYGITPKEGCAVLANTDEKTAEAYPFRVCAIVQFDLQAKQRGAVRYTGSALDKSAIELSAKDGDGPSSEALAGAATYRFRIGDAAWSDGLPCDAGAYTVEAAVGRFMDDEHSIYYIARSAATAQIEIGRRELGLASASVDAKDYDGTCDATVRTVRFSGLIDGQALTRDEDYTAVGRFTDSAPGAAKDATVSVKLKAAGPVARNYVLGNGHDSIGCKAEIRGEGGDGGGSDSGGGNGDGGAIPGTGDRFATGLAELGCLIFASAACMVIAHRTGRRQND